MGFSYEEKAELLALVASSPKWCERVNGAFGHLVNITTVPEIQPFHHIGTGVNDKWHAPSTQGSLFPLRCVSENEPVILYSLDRTGQAPFNFHDQSLMGKRVKVVRGDCEVSTPTCIGKSGVITGWYDFIDTTPGFQCILPASCYHMAVVSGDNGETFNANTSWCDILS